MKPRSKGRRWSGKVTRRSNALDLESNVFKQSNPRRIALSLKRSAKASTRRKARPYQSAMSMTARARTFLKNRSAFWFERKVSCPRLFIGNKTSTFRKM